MPDSHLYLQPTYSVKLPSGPTIVIKKATDYITRLLAHPKADLLFDFKWRYNNGVIKESCTTDGWLELVAYYYDKYKLGYVYMCVCGCVYVCV